VPSRWLVRKEAFEPNRRQFRVTDGMLDRRVAEIVLDGPRIVAVIGELVAAGVPQHVDVNREAELGPFANVLDLPIDGVRRERRVPRSLVNTNLVCGPWSARSLRSARNSSPRIGCVAGLPILDAPGSVAVLKSTWDHSRSQASIARRPCL